MLKYTAIKITLAQFLMPFFSPGETVCLRVFDDRRDSVPPFKGAKIECTAGNIAAKMPELKKHNSLNRGIYFVINYGGHEDADITRINAQFVECDTLSIKEQMAQIKAFKIEPSIIVRTKKSLHVYWLMKDAKVAEFRGIQKRLVKQFNGDPACVNESRVFRLLGFYHCKGEPFMVECIKFNPELRYTQEELSAALPTAPDELDVKAKSSPPCGEQQGLPLVVQRCLFMEHCKKNAKTLNEHDWYSMITNIAVFDGGEAEIYKLSAAYPKYKEEETRQKIQHFIASGTKPITCATIAEKGFSCPKLADGSCGCKAPAALSFKPLELEEMREYLEQYEGTKFTSDNIKTAAEFVTSYLYNAEPLIAEAFIRNEMKDHFELKMPDVKAVLSAYKDAQKKYEDSVDGFRKIEDKKLPVWYVRSQTGGVRFIAGLLVEHMVKNVDAFYSAGSYYFYENGVYAAQDDLAAQAKVQEFLDPRYSSMNAITDVVGQWRAKIRKKESEINSSPYIINLKNGLYDVKKDIFKPHTPEFYSTVQLGAAYDPNAKCPRFLSFLDDILPKEEIYLVQEILGYLLIPINKAQKAFIFVGAANAGKSTLLLVAQEILLGIDNVTNIPWQMLSERFKTAELFGKLANIFADLPSKNIDDNGIFKALTGEDYLTVERKNKNPFRFHPYARLLFSCNTLPTNYGDRSEGFYRRLIIVRFEKSVPENKRDPNLRDKLKREADGILTWALVGLRRLISNGYHFSDTKSTYEELRRYKIESNSALLFLEENCTIEEGAECGREELFAAYREFCTTNGMLFMSQIRFNKELDMANDTIIRAVDKLGKRRTWRGLRFNA